MPGRHPHRLHPVLGTLCCWSRRVVLREAQTHGGNIQVLTGPTGYPEWVSDVEPGSTHDITAARTHALPALHPAAARGLPTLTDKGYVGAGIGTHVPLKGRNLGADNQARNAMISALRAPAERANALLKKTWKALERVTLDPWRIGAIVAAARVQLHLQRPTRRENLNEQAGPDQ